MTKFNPVDHLLDEEKYSTSHRSKYGIIIMIIGVAVAKGMPHDIFILSFIGDWIGYLLHGAGAIPLIDYVHSKTKKNENNKPKSEKPKVVVKDHPMGDSDNVSTYTNRKMLSHEEIF